MKEQFVYDIFIGMILICENGDVEVCIMDPVEDEDRSMLS